MEEEYALKGLPIGSLKDFNTEVNRRFQEEMMTRQLELIPDMGVDLVEFESFSREFHEAIERALATSDTKIPEGFVTPNYSVLEKTLCDELNEAWHAKRKPKEMVLYRQTCLTPPSQSF